MRIKGIIFSIASLVLVGAGVALVAVFFLGQSSTGSTGSSASGFNVPTLKSATGPADTTANAPKDKTLKLTVPKMSRVNNLTVYNAEGDDEEKLKESAIHLEGTGFPWQKEANVYVAGHRLGYPATGSFLVFYDLDKLRNGDEVFITDANGKKYTYKVFREFIVDPTDLSVTEPIKGKNIVTLQTCTLPDYTQRIIVQAELVKES